MARAKLTTYKSKVVVEQVGDNSTQAALEIYHKTKKLIGTVKEITIMQQSKRRLTTITGTRGAMKLTGCSTGYVGEGPRGLFEIVRDAGFSDVTYDDITSGQSVFVQTKD